MPDARKKASMSYVLTDMKPYITKKFISADCIQAKDIPVICRLLLSKYRNVTLVQGVSDNKPNLRVQVKGMFSTEEKVFEVMDNGRNNVKNSKKQNNIDWIDRLEEINAALDDL